jgi:hypothetical protein
MNLIIELSPDEEKCVETARAHGIDVERHLRDAIHRLPAPAPQELPQPRVDRTAELLRQWIAEDATDDEEELERRERDNREFFANIQKNRVNFPVPKV